MDHSSHLDDIACPEGGFLFWDMAGTLIPFDPLTGAPGPLPGCDEFLPELGQHFRMLVTTGDEQGSARGLLSGFGLVNHFEKIFGDLFAPVGKPYGEILRHLGGRPGCSLAIGDRIRSDVASDTPEVVTLLINQNGDIANAGAVSMVIRHLLRLEGNFPAAFEALAGQWEADPGPVGERAGGHITRCWRGDMGFPCQLMRFSHPVLDGDRMIIQI